jgi:hypothetical protein
VQRGGEFGNGIHGRHDVSIQIDPGKAVRDLLARIERSSLAWLGSVDDGYLSRAGNVGGGIGAGICAHDDLKRISKAGLFQKRIEARPDYGFLVMGSNNHTRHLTPP